jgi:hypothetical protein
VIEQTTPSPPPEATAVTPAGNPAAESGARWFWWIASLSGLFVPSGISSMPNVFGFGITPLAESLVPSSHLGAYAVSLALLIFLCVMGYLAVRGRLWAFILGLAVYSLDALILAWMQDWAPVVFHAVAAAFIVRGALAVRRAPQVAA